MEFSWLWTKDREVVENPLRSHQVPWWSARSAIARWGVCGCWIWRRWAIWLQWREILARLRPKRLRTACHGRWSLVANPWLNSRDLQTWSLRWLLLHSTLWCWIWKKWSVEIRPHTEISTAPAATDLRRPPSDRAMAKAASSAGQALQKGAALEVPSPSEIASRSMRSKVCKNVAAADCGLGMFNGVCLLALKYCKILQMKAKSIVVWGICGFFLHWKAPWMHQTWSWLKHWWSCRSHSRVPIWRDPELQLLGILTWISLPNSCRKLACCHDMVFFRFFWCFNINSIENLEIKSWGLLLHVSTYVYTIRAHFGEGWFPHDCHELLGFQESELWWNVAKVSVASTRAEEFSGNFALNSFSQWSTCRFFGCWWMVESLGGLGVGFFGLG